MVFSTSSSSDYRGRFAPSPTGPLHFGSLLAALASYCEARRHNGKWLLRIEDVDGARTRQSALQNILHTLENYGFRWDEDIVYQSQRTKLYQQALEQLQHNHHVYPCACSRQRLNHAPLGVTGERIYPGYCKSNSPDQTQQPFAWRVIVSDETLVFHDAIQGKQKQNLQQECGDFIVKRRDGFFAYHLAVVADDIEQCITHVVRGADILPSTPRHLFLYRLFNKTPPAYMHIPIAINQDGQKLSKQTRAPALPEDGLAALLAAWHFLTQPQPLRTPQSIGAFWDWALAHWDARLIPACSAQPFFPETLRV